MPYQIAGIDVHKKMLAVVVADVEVDDEYRFERLKVGTSPAELRALADWLVEREVEEVVMESTAQYWRPVWEALELHWRPHRRNRDGASPVSGTPIREILQDERIHVSRRRIEHQTRMRTPSDLCDQSKKNASIGSFLWASAIFGVRCTTLYSTTISNGIFKDSGMRSSMVRRLEALVRFAADLASADCSITMSAQRDRRFGRTTGHHELRCCSHVSELDFRAQKTSFGPNCN
jgi:hypothetical protein